MRHKEFQVKVMLANVVAATVRWRSPEETEEEEGKEKGD
jgi:hypothetical protein